MNGADLHTATGAYVLHALPPGERASFERHLAACAACAQEVREFAATTERLGLAVAQVPPPELKERVLRRIDTVRQEPPRMGGRDGVRRWNRSVPRLALAACLAAAVSFGGVAVWQYETARQARVQAQEADESAARLRAVLSAPDAKVASGPLANGGTATVVVSRGRDQAVFIASRLPRLSGSEVYQLWFDDGGTMRSAGLVSGAGGGDAVVMEGPVGKASGMGVTVEPAGGSAQPTSAPIGLMEFPA